MKQKVFFAIRLAAASVFVVSGFMKLMEPYQNFLAAVYSYKILSGDAARVFAIALPWAELIFGVFLAAGLWVRASAAGLWIMNSAFIGAISLALIRRLPINDCGCFGGASWPLEKVLLMDAALWFAFLLLFFQAGNSSWLGLDRYFEMRSKTHRDSKRGVRGKKL